MTVEREQVMAAYQFILARKPKLETTIAEKTALDGLEDVVKSLILSPEFIREFSHATHRGGAAKCLPMGERRVVFLHLPKCGGTTFHNILASWYDPKIFHPERFNRLYTYTAASLAGHKVFSGHFDFYATRMVPGKKFLVSFLRDPVERLVSLYNFHRAHVHDDSHLVKWANTYDIDAYFQNPMVRKHPGVNNTMAHFLSSQPFSKWRTAQNPKTLETLTRQALKNLEKFDFIGFLDRYDQSIAGLARLLGQEIPAEISKHQVLDTLMTQKNFKQIEKQTPSPETLEAMQDLVRYDYAIFRRAQELFPDKVLA